MKKKLISIFLILSLFISLTSINVSAKTMDRYDIDFSKSEEGIVSVQINSDSLIKTKLIIQNDNLKYIYNLTTSKKNESFPLNLGDGTYAVTIYENTYGTKYTDAYSESCLVTIKDGNSVFLTSTQQVNWKEDDESILIANDLVNKALEAKKTKTNNKDVTLTEKEIIEVIYNYIIKNIQYDSTKIDKLSYDYIPDIDVVFEEGKGICYDYAVLFSAMLRSQGIPTKLVKGYSNLINGYHAWNEIYLKSENKWIIVDTTYDADIYRNNLGFNMEKVNENYSMKYEY